MSLFERWGYEYDLPYNVAEIETVYFFFIKCLAQCLVLSKYS